MVVDKKCVHFILSSVLCQYTLKNNVPKGSFCSGDRKGPFGLLKEPFSEQEQFKRKLWPNG